jgi:predicted enzyme involved in methoxymalonyl-ACP biosynthesis
VIILYGQEFVEKIEDKKNNNRHKYLQFYLKSMKKDFLIVILSKIMRRTFGISFKIILICFKRKSYYSSRINWNDLNIKEIATELNLSLNNFTFY